MKAKYWTFLVYLDSAPKNWRELLNDTNVSLAISPIHDQDLNENGELKKAHYHIIIAFNNTTTYNNALEIAKLCNANIIKKVYSMSAIYEYLTHSNEKDKHHYDVNNIILMNNFNLNEYDETTRKSEELNDFKSLINIIINNNITKLSQLFELISNSNNDNLFKILKSNAYLINCLIKENLYKESDKND